MRVKIQAKMIENQKTLIIHFIEGKPNIRGSERFRRFVEKLEEVLKRDLKKVKIVLSPVSLGHPREEFEINWSRFDENAFRLKDYLKDNLK